MRFPFKAIAAFAVSAGLAVGCDRTPTDLAEIEALLAAAGRTSSDARSFDSVLPALLRQAIAAVDKAKGKDGVEDLLSNWRDLQEQLKAEAPGAGRSAIEAKLAEIHAEELRIVHRVLGNNATTRLVSETDAGLAGAELSISAAAGAGRDVTRARAIARQIRQKLAASHTAMSNKSEREALQHAAEAAGMLNTMRHHLLELQRIAGLETLYPRAIEQVTRERGAAAADAMVAKFSALNTRTRVALRSGDRQRAQDGLVQMRAEQIRVVREVLGSHAAHRLVSDVDARSQEIAAALTAFDNAGRDVIKYQRMLRTAVDLGKRASTALDNGDYASALDLGSHAAGLLNTLQHLTWQ